MPNQQSWTCPYCNHKSVILDVNYQETEIKFIKSPKYDLLYYVTFIVCPNPDCQEYSLTCLEYNGQYSKTTGRLRPVDEATKSWNLLPKSNAKPFPNYIPKPIIEDYEEACLIVDKSPKAAATLARRCLQGMIRDFWDIKKRSLYKKIEAIEEKVHPITWKAIDGIRQIGNIGAHMEKDINLIIEVEPNEANLLIELIEFLIDEWYIENHEREMKMKQITSIPKAKKEEKRFRKLVGLTRALTRTHLANSLPLLVLRLFFR